MEKKQKKEPLRFDLSPDIQAQIVGALLTDEYILKRYHQFVKPEYFENPIHREIVKFIVAYYDEYKSITDLSELDHHLSKIVEKKRLPKSEIENVLKDITKHIHVKSNFEYVLNIVVKFARTQAIRNATLEYTKLLKQGKEAQAKAVLDAAHKVALEDRREAEALRDFMEKEIPERDIFVQNWAERKRMTMLAGREKIGKSLIVINMMLQLAKGERFLGFNIPEPRRVLYIQQELSEIDLRIRFEKMLYGRKALSNLFLKTTTGDVLKITNPDHRQIIHSEIEDKEPDLVVFDPYSTFHDKKENSAEEMTEVLWYFSEIMYKFNVGIILIHHYGKPGTVDKTGAHRFRGSSVLGDRPDILICLDKLDPKCKSRLQLDYNEYVEVSFDLRSDAKPLDTILIRNSSTLQYSEAELDEILIGITAEDIMRIVSRAGGKLDQKEVVKIGQQQAAYKSVLNAIGEAERRGYILRETRPGKGSPKVLKVCK
jgi:hypothetical protein